MNNIQITEEILTNDINEILNIIDDKDGRYSVDFYIIKDTQSRAKDKKRWYNVYISGYNDNARDEFLEETIKQLDNLNNKLKNGCGIGDFLNPDECNGNNTNIETVGEHITLLQNIDEIKTFSVIFNQIIQGGRPLRKYKNEKIIGYALDINLGRLGRVIAFIKSRNIKMIKKGSLVYIDKLIKLENDIILVPLKIDAIYVEYNNRKYVIILERTEFERLFKFYEYYKEKSKECLDNLTKLGIIKINPNVKKEILNSKKYARKLTQLYESGVFNFHDENGNLIKSKHNKFIKLLKTAKNHDKLKNDIPYEIITNNGKTIIKIPSKEALIWFIKVCNKEVLTDLLQEDIYIVEKKVSYQTKLDLWM